jgi:glycosyltransferase involved in cell wall biosynthesis
MSTKRIKRKSILFVYTGLSTFVKNDFDILSSVHMVEKYHFAPVKGIPKNAREISKQFFFLLIHGWKYDSFYCWFADYHSFLPVLFAKIFRKKSFVVIGGYDVCRIRNMNYGAFCTPFRGWFCANSMRNASCILPVSMYVARKVKIIAPRTKTKMIYNCVTTEPSNTCEMQKTDTILTVGLIDNERTFYLKGIDTFIEIARKLPGFRFQIVGINQKALTYKLGNIPINLCLFGRVTPEELGSFYQKARIYCQLSRSESFGVSIAEAMTYGVFPIVTNEGGMPEVVGAVGAVVERDPQHIAELITDRLLKDGFPDETRIRTQVSVLFSKRQRAESLLQIIDTV